MKKLILLSIIIISLLIRIVKLDAFPYGLNADEAALGYNSYSLLLTGKDEHGHSWPVNLESFGDFKPGGYAYILLPFIKIFGLNDFVVRLPSAIFGILGVLGIYLLTSKVLDNKNIGLVAAAIASINPWLIHFSRGAWEVNVSTTLIIFGVYFFINWVKSNKIIYIVFSVLLFASSMYVYQSARILVPLLVSGIVFIYLKELLKQKKVLISSVLLGLVLIIPLVISVLTSDASSRFSGVGFLSDEGPLNRVKELRGQYDQITLFNRLLHNRPVIYSIEFFQNYLDHYDLDFLFLNGDKIQRSRIPETGQFHFIEIIFLILGVISVSKLLNDKKVKIIIYWLLVAPVPAALTFQTPHALRAHSMSIPLIILISMGIYSLIRYVKDKKYRYLMICFVISFYWWSFARFVNQYVFQYPYMYPSSWQAEFKQLVETVVMKQNSYSKIIVTDRYDQPYILFLYYSKYDPALFQSDHQLTFRDKFNFSTVRSYSKYEFRSINKELVDNTKNTLIIAHPDEINGLGLDITDKINYSNGKPAFLILEK